MRIITRYLLREYLVNLFYCLTGFAMIFVVFDLFDRLSKMLKAETPFWVAVKYYLCMLASAAPYLLPASLLLATLYTLWQLSRHQEVTAMRANGIGLYRIVLPFLAVGLAASVLTGAVMEFIAPRATFWATNLSRNRHQVAERMLVPHHAYYNANDRRQWLIDLFDLNTPRFMKGIKITEERPDGTRIREVEARRARYMDGNWWLYGVQVQHFDRDDNPVGTLTPEIAGPDSIVEMREYDETPEDIVLGLRDWEMLSSLEMLKYLRNHPNISHRSAVHRRFDIHNRLAAPWACLVVALFGIPAGVQGGRRSALSGIFLAVAMFFAFYAFSQVGIFVGKREVVWPWLGAWLPNIVFLATGCVMIWRMR